MTIVVTEAYGDYEWMAFYEKEPHLRVYADTHNGALGKLIMEYPKDIWVKRV